MRMSFSLTQMCGVSGFIFDDSEFVAAWLFADEENKKEIKEKLAENKTYPVMKGSTTCARINASTCFLDKEIKVDHIYRGSQLLYINNRASSKNGTLDKQYFLIPSEEESPEAALKKQFFDKNIKKLPLPVHTDWESFFWEGIVPFFKELPSYGTVPYKGYVLSLPSLETIQNLVEESHVKSEFQKRFKRVPRLECLLSIGDVENFDFKAWQQFLDAIGGVESLTKLEIQRQRGVVRAFELLGHEDSKLIIDNIELWHTVSLRPINILVRITEDKAEKGKIRRAFKILIDQYFDNQGMLYPAISNFEALYKENVQNILNKNFDSVEKFLNQIKYDNVTMGAEELANVCSLAKVSANEYKKFEELYLKYFDDIMIAPRSYPTISNDYGKNLTWELLDMSIPKAWTVGIETNCCMHPDSVGGACLVYAARNPQTSGILRVSERGKTIAQSFVWLGDTDKAGKRTLVLDNIEVQGNTIRETVKDAYRDFAEKMEFYARLFNFKAITVGSGYSDIDLNTLCIEKLQDSSPLYAPKPNGMGYYDASNQWLLKKF